MNISDEHVHNSKALPDLVNDLIRSDKKITIGKFIAYGTYEGNGIFRCLVDDGVLPGTKVRKNFRVGWKKVIF